MSKELLVVIGRQFRAHAPIPPIKYRVGAHYAPLATAHDESWAVEGGEMQQG